MGMDDGGRVAGTVRILFSEKELDQRILVKSMRRFNKNVDVLRVCFQCSS